MRRLSMCAAGLSVAMVAMTAQANLLDDPSFSAATHDTTDSNSNWTLTVDLPDGTNPSARFRQDNWAQQDGPMGVWFRGFEGGQDPGDPGANADIAQDVVVAQAGDYALTFWTRRESNFMTDGIAGEAWTASLSSSGGPSSSLDLLADVAPDGQWVQQSLLLSGVGAGDTLSVEVSMVEAFINSQTGGQNSAFVDNFSLQLIPEPTSLALVGLGVLGALTTRRKR